MLQPDSSPSHKPPKEPHVMPIVYLILDRMWARWKQLLINNVITYPNLLGKSEKGTNRFYCHGENLMQNPYLLTEYKFERVVKDDGTFV